jgi:hypothetical protein
MNWANTMAGNADDAANSQATEDRGAESSVSSGSWDPHQVWLTRVKQPRDSRPPVPQAAPVKVQPRATAPHFWSRAAR